MEGVVDNQIQDGVELADVSMNGDEANESDNVGDRPIRKAKRLLTRQTSGGDNASNNNTQQATKKLLPFSKNSRKSRDGRGRGLPKKGKQQINRIQIGSSICCSKSRTNCFVFLMESSYQVCTKSTQWLVLNANRNLLITVFIEIKNKLVSLIKIRIFIVNKLINLENKI